MVDKLDPSGNARCDGAPHAGSAGAAAWIRNRAAHRTGERRHGTAEPGTIYASLVRLQQRGWIKAEWGTSDNNRKAKFYALTKSGQKHLASETRNWSRLSAVMSRVLALGNEEG